MVTWFVIETPWLKPWFRLCRNDRVSRPWVFWNGFQISISSAGHSAVVTL